jgi:hypothetical protein
MASLSGSFHIYHIGVSRIIVILIRPIRVGRMVISLNRGRGRRLDTLEVLATALQLTSKSSSPVTQNIVSMGGWNV